MNFHFNTKKSFIFAIVSRSAISLVVNVVGIFIFLLWLYPGSY